MSWGYYREFFRPSRPRRATGGIKAKSTRGGFGTTWWGKRWVEVLESFNIGARLDRGKRYARSGQVLKIDIASGKVLAKVQGSMSEPYSVVIEVKRIAAKDWDRAVKALAEQAIFAAKLLAGEMPADVEKVFADISLSLFPERIQDLTTECSCPDWSNPCKHIAAVYYLIAEEFDRNPFLLFRMRGLDRDDLVTKLAAVPPQESNDPVEFASEMLPYAKPLRAPETIRPLPSEPKAEPLPADPAAFWCDPKLPEDFFGPVEPPPVHAALLKRLGGFPFWRGVRPLEQLLAPIYERASARGMAVFLGETKPI
jgi:uncharacterized Zn finger protein